ncbi:MAG: phasin family protein [Hyphomicrobiales bacterium]|nr:phasin family protein [Hyphomicrobiales bacterium]
MTRSFVGAGTLGKEVLQTGAHSLGAVVLDAHTIAVEASHYTIKVLEAGEDALRSFAAATSFGTVAEVQSRYLEQSYKTFVAEAARLAELYADMAKDAYSPFEAIAVRAK